MTSKSQIAAEFPHLNKYVEMFEKHISEIDPLQLTILNGHLIIESALDNILSTIFFHPEHIEEAELEFNQKVHVARSYALRKNKEPVWNLILVINAVRNEIAHNLGEGMKREKKMARLRRLYLAHVSAEDAKKREDAADYVIAALACVSCIGFLGMFEDDMRGLRGHIDALDAGMNPNEQRITPKR